MFEVGSGQLRSYSSASVSVQPSNHTRSPCVMRAGAVEAAVDEPDVGHPAGVELGTRQTAAVELDTCERGVLQPDAGELTLVEHDVDQASAFHLRAG